MVADFLDDVGAKYPPLPPLPDDYKSNGLDIFEASRLGDLRQLQWLVEREGADVNQRDGNGWTLLHWAAYYGHAVCSVPAVSSR